MNRNFHVPLYALLTMAALLLMVCGGSPRAMAQAQTGDKSSVQAAQAVTVAQTRERLAQKARLVSGITTLADVTRALSEQTGLQIEAVPYLREHRLTVSMNNMSAAAILDTLGDLNGWKWRIAGPGHVVVERPSVKTPQTLEDVSFALMSALPKDFQRFLGSDGVLHEPMYHSPSGLFKINGEFKVIPPARDAQMRYGISYESNTAHGLHFLDTLLPKILDQKPLLYADMTPVQQQTVVSLTTMRCLQDIVLFQHNLLSGVLRPHQRDPEQIDVSVQNGNIMLIGTYINEIINGVRHTQASGGRNFEIDAPATNNSKTLHF